MASEPGISVLDRGPVTLESALFKISDARIRWRMIDLFIDATRALDEGVYEVVILGARRMACLYGLMLTAGLPSPRRGTFVSDRFLEFAQEAEWWTKPRKVLLLDDSHRTGASLRRRLDRLAGAGSGDHELTTHVCYYEVNDNGPPDPMAVGLSADECQRTGHEIAAALAEGVVPLITDFPISHEIVASHKEFEQFMNCDGWSSYDVTTSIVAGTGTRSYSLVPTPELLDSIREQLGPLGGLLEVAKVRIFADVGFRQVRFRVVPIVLLGSVLESDIARIFAAKGYASIGADPNGTGLAVVSYMLSRLLLARFRESAASDEISISTDYGLLEVYFGRALLDQIRAENQTDHFSDFDQLMESGSALDLLADANLNEQLGQFDAILSSGRYMIGDDLVRPIQGVLSLLDAQGEDRAFTTMSTVSRHLKASTHVIGLALDVLNDLGHAVPRFVRDEKGGLARGFRPAEHIVAMGTYASIDRTVKISVGDTETNIRYTAVAGKQLV